MLLQDEENSALSNLSKETGDIPRILQIPGMSVPSSSVCEVHDLLYLLLCTQKGEVESSHCQLSGSSLEALRGRTTRHTRAKRTWMDN